MNEYVQHCVIDLEIDVVSSHYTNMTKYYFNQSAQMLVQMDK